MFGRKLSKAEYSVTGSQNLRRKIHHGLMKRAEETDEMETGTIFIMPGRKTAVSLGKSCKDDSYGHFSLDIYKMTYLRNFRPLSSERKFFGEELYGDLMMLKYGFSRVETDGRFSCLFESPNIDSEDLPEPRKIWVRTCIISAYHEIPPGGAWWENPADYRRNFLTTEYVWREG